MKISWEESDKSKIKTTIQTMLKNQSLDSLTEKKLRRGIEKELGFPELSLDEENIKLFIKEIINQFILKNENSSDKDDDDNNEKNEEQNEDKKKEQDEMELSELEEEGVKEKKTKGKKSVNNKKKEEKIVKGKAKEKENGIETRLNNLKSYVVKCGVRKQWKKIFEGLTIQQQVKKVESILKELGMEGRPSNEKAKKIAMKRELQMEKESLDTSNIINTDNLPSRKSRRKRNYFEFEESDENEVEGNNNKKEENENEENEKESEDDEKEENGNNESHNEKEEMENKKVKKDNTNDENKQNGDNEEKQNGDNEEKQNNANVNNEQENIISIIGQDDPLAKMIFSSPTPQNE